MRMIMTTLGEGDAALLLVERGHAREDLALQQLQGRPAAGADVAHLLGQA